MCCVYKQVSFKPEYRETPHTHSRMANPPDIVALSRMRLSKKMFSESSLKKSAIETIIGSFNSCTSFNEQNELAARTSPALRDELLQEVLRRIKCPEKFEKLARVIPFLLSTLTKTLDLNDLGHQMSYDYVELAYIDEVLSKAAHLAPNIQQLCFTNGGTLSHS
ncbi:Hypothetical predicted protein [Cloeon dipterum]|uniref:Uncharacterized protein n=1 Tax=Cloeon dipterum TaxID=197152 RepID=A0A8S1E0Q9_9INSE|nr:Hypothetical predicted protein [Cloeon dipterum]